MREVSTKFGMTLLVEPLYPCGLFTVAMQVPMHQFQLCRSLCARHPRCHRRCLRPRCLRHRRRPAPCRPRPRTRLPCVARRNTTLVSHYIHLLVHARKKLIFPGGVTLFHSSRFAGLSICCLGVVAPIVCGPAACCGTVTYTTASQSCCQNMIVPGGTGFACCRK